MKRFLLLFLLAAVIAVGALVIPDTASGDRADRAPDESPEAAFVKRTIPEDHAPKSHQGVVLSESGDPIAGVEVYATEPLTYASETAVATRTDEQGRFGLDLAQPEEIVVVCRKRGFIPVILPASNELEVVLRRGESITGRVVDAAGISLEGARVHARAISVTHAIATDESGLFPGPDAVHFATATTDVDGYFEIPGLDPGIPHIIEATAEGHCTVGSRAPIRIPPCHAGEIRLHRVYIGVLGLRRNGVDCTPDRRAAGRINVFCPPGFQRPWSGVPRRRFSPAIEQRLAELAKEGGAYVVVSSRPRTEPEVIPPVLRIRFRPDARTVAQEEIDLVRIGTDGWDRRQWIEIPPESPEPPGTLVVRSKQSARFKVTRLGGYSLGSILCTRYDSERRAHVAVLAPGRYSISWLPHEFMSALGLRAWRADIAAGEVTELTVDLRPIRGVTFDPRLPSGAPARETSLSLLRTGHDGKQECSLKTLACVDGPESIQLPPGLRGRVEVGVWKLGYERASATLEIGDEDVTWSPVLKPIPSERLVRPR